MSYFSEELVTNSDFSNWVGDNPVSWNAAGQSPPDPEVSEVGAGEGHGGVGTGMCNIYTSVGVAVFISQNVSVVVGRKYRLSINVDTVTLGAIIVRDGAAESAWTTKTISSTGITTFTFVAINPVVTLLVAQEGSNPTDVTFDDISVVEGIPEDLYLSRTGQRFSSFPEN